MSLDAIVFDELDNKTPEQLGALYKAISGFVPAENLVDWHRRHPMEKSGYNDSEEEETLVIVSGERDARALFRLEAAWGSKVSPWDGKSNDVFQTVACPTEAQFRGILVAVLGQAKCPTDVIAVKAFAQTFELLVTQGWTLRYSNLGLALDQVDLDVRMTDNEHDLVMTLNFTPVRVEPVPLGLDFPYYTTMGFWNGNSPNGRSAQILGFLQGKWHQLAMFNSWAGGAEDRYVGPVLPDAILEAVIPLVTEHAVMQAPVLQQLIHGLKVAIPGLEFTYVSHTSMLGGGKASVLGRSQVNDEKRQYNIQFKTGV